MPCRSELYHLTNLQLVTNIICCKKANFISNNFERIDLLKYMRKSRLKYLYLCFHLGLLIILIKYNNKDRTNKPFINSNKAFVDNKLEFGCFKLFSSTLKQPNFVITYTSVKQSNQHHACCSQKLVEVN